MRYYFTRDFDAPELLKLPIWHYHITANLNVIIVFSTHVPISVSFHVKLGYYIYVYETFRKQITYISPAPILLKIDETMN